MCLEVKDSKMVELHNGSQLPELSIKEETAMKAALCPEQEIKLILLTLRYRYLLEQLVFLS